MTAQDPLCWTAGLQRLTRNTETAIQTFSICTAVAPYAEAGRPIDLEPVYFSKPLGHQHCCRKEFICLLKHSRDAERDAYARGLSMLTRGAPLHVPAILDVSSGAFCR